MNGINCFIFLISSSLFFDLKITAIMAILFDNTEGNPGWVLLFIMICFCVWALRYLDSDLPKQAKTQNNPQSNTPLKATKDNEDKIQEKGSRSKQEQPKEQKTQPNYENKYKRTKEYKTIVCGNIESIIFNNAEFLTFSEVSSFSEDKYILNCIKALNESFTINEDTNDREIQTFFYEKQYAKCAEAIMRQMGLFENKIKITSYANDKFPSKDCAAFVTLPLNNMPLYGSEQFRNMRIPISIKMSLTDSYETFVYSIAHELSHIVLHSVSTPLRVSEIATDIFVMFCGFIPIMEKGKKQPIGEYTTEYGYLDDNNFKLAKSKIIELRIKK